MNLSHAEIESLVRVVIARLAGQELRAQDTTPTASETTWIEEPVITLETIRRLKPKPEQTLEVSSSAVLTPAAADELKDLGVSLKRQTVLAKQSITVFAEPENIDTLLPKVQQQLQQNGTVISRSERPYELTSLAAGIPNARVVQLATASDLQAAVEQASPNLIVLDAHSWGFASAQRLSQRWSRLLGDQRQIGGSQ